MAAYLAGVQRGQQLEVKYKGEWELVTVIDVKTDKRGQPVALVSKNTKPEWAYFTRLSPKNVKSTSLVQAIGEYKVIRTEHEKKRRNQQRKRKEAGLPGWTPFSDSDKSRLAALLEAGLSLTKAATQLGVKRDVVRRMARGWRACLCPRCNRVIFGRHRDHGGAYIGVICGHWVQPMDGLGQGLQAKAAADRLGLKLLRVDPPVLIEDGRDDPTYRRLGRKSASIVLIAHVGKNRQRVATFRWLGFGKATAS